MVLYSPGFKRNIQILIVVSVVIVTAILTGFYVVQEKTYVDERSERSTQNLKKAFASVLSEMEHFYVYRSKAILAMPGVIDEIKRSDTHALYATVLPKYTALKRENPDLILLQFHAANGHSIVRMHRKNEFGDDIASKRPMLRATHATKRIHTGFEGGIQGIAYRVVIPVFDKETYLGAIEFGVSTDFIINKLKNLVSTDAVLMIHQSKIAAADAQMYKKGIGEFRFAQENVPNMSLIERYTRENRQLDPKIISIGTQNYEINPIFLYDDSHETVGAVLCIQDITGSYQNFFETFLKSSMLAVVMSFLFLTFFEYAFGKLLNKIRFQDEYIRTILNSQKNIILVSDGKDIVFANQAFLSFFDYTTLDDFKKIHRCICDFFDQSDSEHYLQPVMENLIWTEYILKYPGQEHKAKITLDTKMSIFSVNAEMMQFEGETRYVVVFTDITRLNELATLDSLTRIPNRFQFNKAYEYSFNMSNRTGRPLALILLDIDKFKNVNDEFGHLVGDDILKALSGFIRRHIRKSDVFARWGGEEFVILLPDTSLESAAVMADSLRLKIAAHTFVFVKQLTCSMGVVEYNPPETEDELIARADANLYRAKNEGRNRVIAS